MCCSVILCKCSADVLQTLVLTNIALNPSANKELAQESHLQTNSSGSRGEETPAVT